MSCKAVYFQYYHYYSDNYFKFNYYDYHFYYHVDGKPEEDDVTTKTLELQNLAQSFREHSVEYVLEVSSLGEEITRWGPVPDRSQTLIPQLSKYLVNVNEVKLLD